MTFRVGMPIAMVAPWPDSPTNFCEQFTVMGVVYTIRSIFEIAGCAACHVNEIANTPHLYYVRELGSNIFIEQPFPLSNFRPVVSRKTDISIFKEILNTDHLDNRRVVVFEPCPVDGWGEAS